MRVLHVVASNRARGAETFALDLIGDLKRRGVEQRTAVIHHVEDGYDFGVESVSLTGSRLIALARLHRLIRSWRPDVVQAHGGESLKWLMPTLVRPAFPPVVYRRIGMTPSWMAGSLRKRTYGFIIRRAERIVAVAEAAATQLVEEFDVSSSSIELIPNGVDEGRLHRSKSRQQMRRELDLELDDPVVLFAGALNEEKNPVELVTVARWLCARLDRATFLVAGDGPQKSALSEAMTDAGLSRNVRLLGSRTDIPDLLGASDALVMTSRTEGTPAIAIEAGFAGLPIVAPRVGGIPEIVLDGTSGLLVSSGDSRGLAENLWKLLTDRPRAELMGSLGRGRCRELFEISSIGTRYLDLYERIREQQQPGAHRALRGIKTSS